MSLHKFLMASLLISLASCAKFDLAVIASDIVSETPAPSVPTSFTISAPSAANTSVLNSVSFSINISGASSINLTSSDITIDGFGGPTATQNCSVDVVDGTTPSPTVTISNCLGAQSVAPGTVFIGITVAAGVVQFVDSTSSVSTTSSATDQVEILSVPEATMRFGVGIPNPLGGADLSSTLSLPFKTGFNHDLVIDWGDGSEVSRVTSDADPDKVHTYSSGDTYTVKIYGSSEAFGDSNAAAEYKRQLFEVPDLGNLGWLDLSYAFLNARNLTTFSGGDTSLVTDMSEMFRDAAAVTPDTSTWETSQVTNMNRIFSNAGSANPNTTNWDVSQVTDFSFMFSGATVANPETSTWDTSSALSMRGMFNDASAANPNTTNWNTSQVTNMSRMFSGTFAVGNTVADPDTSNWNTSNVTSMAGMFSDAAAANPDTSGWDTSSVTSMSSMFSGTSVATPDTSGWDTSSVTSMSSMFSQARVANPNTSSWDTSNVTDMQTMFISAVAANPDTSGWNTSRVTSMRTMFSGARMANPNTSGWNTSLVTNMGNMFSGADIANPDTSGWNTSRVTRMAGMFYQAPAAAPNTSGWNTSRVTDMRGMFTDATSANPDTSTWSYAAISYSAFSGLTDLFEGATALSSTNYDAFLTNLNSQNPGGTDSILAPTCYNNLSSGTARSNLISMGWTVNDGGACP